MSEKYYPTYKINPESIYGSGIVTANKFPHTNTTTSVITGSFPQDKKISPPIYQTGLSFKPQDTNGYRVLKVPYNNKLKLYNNYYSTQQSNKNIIPDLEPSTKEKIVSKIKKITSDFANKRPTKNTNTSKSSELEENLDEDVKTIANDITNVKKNTKLMPDQINNLDDEDFLNEIIKPEPTDVDYYGRSKKMWINDHYLYSLEPRYTSVVYPWRAYTWMYPVTPNTDNYYIDNINSSPADPLIVSNDLTNRGNYQSSYLRSNMLKEDFDLIPECKKNYNILYFIIGIVILTIIFYKE
jgi:hypothetical protein